MQSEGHCLGHCCPSRDEQAASQPGGISRDLPIPPGVMFFLLASQAGSLSPRALLSEEGKKSAGPSWPDCLVLSRVSIWPQTLSRGL